MPLQSIFVWSYIILNVQSANERHTSLLMTSGFLKRIKYDMAPGVASLCGRERQEAYRIASVEASDHITRVVQFKSNLSQ